ncbi:hypothetical protein ANN_15805 [Periplaneta americana]|uniref:Uncharacterized protein n=1 Tax=Periplaneta americana TaxID=6978 RepID=A0ABQ8SI47_PERAM|nr:hypothetical protein ANN_15805 [Periplaneta americana]
MTIVEWAPRLSDLNPMDFAIWGNAKAEVYAEKIRDVEHLRQRIIAACRPTVEEIQRNCAKEEQRLRVFENKILRKIFGAKRDEVTGEWRKLHNGELHALFSSPDIIRNIKSRRLRWAGHVAHMGESRNAYRVLVERLEGKRHLERPRRRWEDNIKMDLREVGNVDRDWINLAQDRDRWRVYVRASYSSRRLRRGIVRSKPDEGVSFDKVRKRQKASNMKTDDGNDCDTSGGGCCGDDGGDYGCDDGGGNVVVVMAVVNVVVVVIVGDSGCDSENCCDGEYGCGCGDGRVVAVVAVVVMTVVMVVVMAAVVAVVAMAVVMVVVMTALVAIRPKGGGYSCGGCDCGDDGGGYGILGCSDSGGCCDGGDGCAFVDGNCGYGCGDEGCGFGDSNCGCGDVAMVVAVIL